jgi:hypothetical protein
VPAADVEPPPMGRVTGRGEGEPLGGARLGRHDELREALRLLARRGRRTDANTARTVDSKSRRGSPPRAPSLLAVGLEPDPRIGPQTEVGNADDDRKYASAATQSSARSFRT